MKKIGLLVLLLAVSLTAFSQRSIGAASVAAPPRSSGTAAAATTASTAAEPASRSITIGNSAVALDGAWKFQPGDSLRVNGAPVWAQPGFDDSKWATMDLTPKAGSIDPAYGTPGFVPGWTSEGFPDLDGYAWYRLRLRVMDAGQPLQLKMPNDFDDTYQVYANGQYMGEFGKFSPTGVTVYSARTFSFSLPSPGPKGAMELALRFYMTPETRFQSADAGGMHLPPTVGLASTVQMLQAADNDANLHYYASAILQSILFLVVIPLVLWAWLKNRQERTYFWLFWALVVSPARTAVLLVGNLASVISLGWQSILLSVLLDPLVLPLWIMFWWHWFAFRRQRWIPRLAWALAIAEILALFVLRGVITGVELVPRAWLHWMNSAAVFLTGALGVLLLFVLVAGFRRDRTEALLATVPILLLEIASFSTYLLNLGISIEFYPFGIGINAGAIALILMVLVIGVLVLRRFVRTQIGQEVARKAIAQDMEQARELQQTVLIPEAVGSGAFRVETEYRPAQTVGGDFFQTLARPDGSLLVVIGDVSGKGVSAAMLVAVMVGAIRARADESFDPAAMLAMLNHRLLGRSGGHFASCIAAEIQPDGRMRIANAGHLPPYLNGKEMDLEGSLPLGIAGEAEYPAQDLMLRPGDRLTFMTDGVVEATNSMKELFGFERTRQISGGRAAAIAEQAQSFGQEDDITVVGVEFAGAAATV